MNYSSGAIAKFLQCFEKKNIRLESDNLEKLKESIFEAIDVSKKIYVETCKNSLIQYEVDEINYTTKIVERRKEVYPYKIFYTISTDREKELLNSIENTFVYFRHGCFDLNGLYEKIYEKNTEIVTSYQFDLIRNNLDGVSDELLLKFYCHIGYLDITLNILCCLRNQSIDTFDISSIEMYRFGKLKTITYQISFENFLCQNFIEYYSGYKDFDKLQKFIESHDDRKNKEIFLQISADAKSLSIEIFPNDINSLLCELNDNYQMLISNEILYSKNFSVNYYNNHSDHSLKFVWKNKNNLNICVSKSIRKNEKIEF